MTNENYDETVVRVYKKDCHDVDYEFSKGDKAFFKKNDNGKLICHREDGPAIEYINGNKDWYIEGKLHREDGPAIEYADGDKVWYINGQRHRLDGPAIECLDGYKRWYIEGEEYTEQVFNKKIQKMNVSKTPSCEGKIVEIDGKKYKLQEIG